VGSALQGRRRELRHLVHNLSLLSSAAGRRDADLRRAVAAGGAVLQAVAKPEGALRRAIAQLPGTLDDADHSLGSVRALADRLGPASDALLPVARHAPAALRAATTLSHAGTPVLRDDLRPLVSQLQPVAKRLVPATHQLNEVTPSLTSAFQVLNYLVNEIGDDPPGPDRGYLFWLPWFLHNVNSFVSVADAHGAVWRGLDEVACTTITGNRDIRKALGPVLASIGC
jgi:phospholipid/cholesterol/gamma-HCH transport system substrate-binding protein